MDDNSASVPYRQSPTVLFFYSNTLNRRRQQQATWTKTDAQCLEPTQKQTGTTAPRIHVFVIATKKLQQKQRKRNRCFVKKKTGSARAASWTPVSEKFSTIYIFYYSRQRIGSSKVNQR
jgi:hypothetical protein